MKTANDHPRFFRKIIQPDFSTFTVRFNYCEYRKTHRNPLNFSVSVITKSVCKIAGKIGFIVGKLRANFAKFKFPPIMITLGPFLIARLSFFPHFRRYFSAIFAGGFKYYEYSWNQREIPRFFGSVIIKSDRKNRKIRLYYFSEKLRVVISFR